VESDLLKPNATPLVRKLVALEVRRARELLTSGVPLASTLPLRPRVAVAGFTAGGAAALDAIKRAKHDVLGVRCRPTKVGVARHMLRYFVEASIEKVRA
jgi:phytoene/squalene synthetase